MLTRSTTCLGATAGATGWEKNALGATRICVFSLSPPSTWIKYVLSLNLPSGGHGFKVSELTPLGKWAPVAPAALVLLKAPKDGRAVKFLSPLEPHLHHTDTFFLHYCWERCFVWTLKWLFLSCRFQRHLQRAYSCADFLMSFAHCFWCQEGHHILIFTVFYLLLFHQ